MSASLAVEALSFSYTEREVLKGISFEVQPGEILGVLGPNASGKTTLLKNLAGLLQPKRGRVLLDGRDLAGLPHKERARRIGFVPQEEDIFLPFSVEQVVLMGRAPYLGLWGFETGADLQKAREAMEATEVWELRERNLQDLSGGERQRVAIARALAQEASILLLDEPTSHLDIHYQTEILELCDALNRTQGLTFVLSLHDLNLASLYCRRLLILKEGSLFALGEPPSVITSETLATVYRAHAKIGLHPETGLPYTLPIRKRS